MLLATKPDERIKNLRRMIKIIESTKHNPLKQPAWKGIDFDDKGDCSFWFGGVFYRVDASLIESKMGTEVTDFKISGGYNEPKYQQVRCTITIRDYDEDILREWLLENNHLWEVISE